jgi:hypothetical protein
MDRPTPQREREHGIPASGPNKVQWEVVRHSLRSRSNPRQGRSDAATDFLQDCCGQSPARLTGPLGSSILRIWSPWMVFQGLYDAARPPNFSFLGHVLLAQSEEHTLVTGGKIAARRRHLHRLLTVITVTAAPIASRLLLWPTSFRINQWFCVGFPFVEKINRSVVRSDDAVQLPVIVNVRDGHSPRRKADQCCPLKSGHENCDVT